MENNIKVRKELWESVLNLTDEQLNKVVADGKWTIAQVLEHLYLTEKVVVRSFPHAEKMNADNQVKLRKLHYVVDRTQKITAPKFLEPSSEYQTMEQLKEKLDNSRGALTKILEVVSEEDLNGKFMPHPAFGALTLAQWISIIGYHEKRHLEQIEEIKSALKK